MPSFYERLWGYAFCHSDHRDIGGMLVGVTPDRSQAEMFERATSALELIAEAEPRRHDRMRRDLRWILFTFGDSGRYVPGVEGCVIGFNFVRRKSTVELAMTIVHEATHARLDKAGCRYEGDDRERIERVCVEASIAFASKVPDSQEAIARLDQVFDTPWWTDAAQKEDARGELRALGVPAWLTRLLLGRGRAAF